MFTTAFRHSETKRLAAGELMRETDMAMAAVAAKVGVPYATVCRWNQYHNWRPWFRRKAPRLSPWRWSKPRLAALERVYRQPGVDPGDLAQAVGGDRNHHRAFFRECGFTARAERAPSDALSNDELSDTLRRHVARQIGSFDAWLSMPKDAADSAKILRDLGGLKRLIDELDDDASAPAAEPAPEAPQAPTSEVDELRAAIAARFARLAGEGPPEPPAPPHAASS